MVRIKPMLSILFVLVLLLSGVACGGTSADVSDETTTTQTTTTTKPTTTTTTEPTTSTTAATTTVAPTAAPVSTTKKSTTTAPPTTTTPQPEPSFHLEIFGTEVLCTMQMQSEDTMVLSGVGSDHWGGASMALTVEVYEKLIKNASFKNSKIEISNATKVTTFGIGSTPYFTGRDPETYYQMYVKNYYTRSVTITRTRTDLIIDKP